MQYISADLLARIKNKDPEAFEQLLALMDDFLRATVDYALWWLRRAGVHVSHELRADLLQEARIALWKTALAFDFERSQDFSTYARWKVWSYLRAYAARIVKQEHHEVLPFRLTDVRSIDVQDDDAFWVIPPHWYDDTIAPLDRWIMVLYLAGFGMDDIAKITGYSRKTVRKYLLRGIERLGA